MVLLSEMEKEQVGKEIKRSALHCTGQASQMVLVVKNLPANAGDIRDVSSIPGLGRSSGEGHGNPLQYPGEGYGNALQYSCLRILWTKGAWKATVHGVEKNQTGMSN